MPKLTRRIKKNKINRTIKIGGDNEAKIGENNSERKGLLDIVGNKISNIASSAATTIGDTGLKLVGLERIDKSKEDQKVGDSASGIVSDVGNVVDKTGAALIENVNDVLGSDIVQETTAQAAENTANLVKEGAEKFNEALNNPQVKEEVVKAIDKAGEIGAVVVEAAEKPVEKAVDIAANAASKATGAALSGIIKVSTDALGAVPFFGAIIDAGKMINDGSKAATAVVEAGSEAIEVASDAFIETKENVEKSLKLLEEKKKESDKVENRTMRSINEFENPIPQMTQTTQKGGRKTKRRLTKHRAKSKRVRFAI